ncbi:hypothetical protein E1289_07060 [Actinomadura sp. 6K520]|nr:hypothetical protein E1289_07060 [Actinomadura sp. 6K520]
MVFLDALMVKVRANRVPHDKPAHLTVGIDSDGDRHVLGIWVPKAGNGPIGPRGIGESAAGDDPPGSERSHRPPHDPARRRGRTPPPSATKR